MRKNFKRVLLFSLIVLTLVVLTVVGASAMTDAEAIDAGYTVRIGDEGGTYYNTLADAVSAAEAGDTITVIQGHQLSAALTIDKSLTIEGQGLQIIAAGKTEITNSAVVTLNNFSLSNTATSYGINVTGSSNVTIDGALTSIIATKDVAVQCGAGTLTIKDGTFSTEASGKTVLWANSATSVLTVDGGTIKTTGGSGRLLGMSYAKTFTINGGTFTHGGSNNLFYVTGGSLITINGGDFSYSTTSNNNGIIYSYHASAAAKFVINGGTFTGNQKVIASYGAVEINGGTFKGLAELTRSTYCSLTMTGGTFNGDITTNKALAITLSGNAVVNGNIALQNAGASLTINSRDAQIVATGDAITMTGGTLTMTYGSITAGGTAVVASNGATGTITGGVINAATAVSGDGITVSIPATDADAIEKGFSVRIGEEGELYYATLADAVAAAHEGETITVLKEHSLTAALTISKSLNIEGNGLQITAAGVTTIGNNAVVTLNNLKLSNTASGIGINVIGGAKVTIDGANTHITATKAIALQISGGSLNVKDGYFTTQATGYNVLWSNDAASVVVIDGGKFETTGGSGRLLGMSNATEFTINNGTFIHGGTGNNLFQVTGGALLTIHNGEFSSPNYTGGIIWTSTANSKFVINGGTFNAKQYVLASNGPVVINGGTFYGIAQLTRNDGGTLTITGGTFNGDITVTKKTSLTISGDAVVNGNISLGNAGAVMTISGGTIQNTTADTPLISITVAGATITINNRDAQLIAAGDAISMNGGKLTMTEGSITAAGTAVVATNGATGSITGGVIKAATRLSGDAAEGVTISIPENDTDAIEKGFFVRIGAEGERYYNTLAQAVAAARDGDTITVLKEHELTAALTINKSLTIEGNGHQISAAGVTTINGGAVVTLNNFKLSNTTSGIGINVTGGAKVTIDGALSSVTATKEIALQISGGSLNVKAGYFTTENSGKNVLWSNHADSVVVIDGGTFETTGGSGRLLGMSNAAEFTINNGTFIHGGTGNNLFQVTGGALLTIHNGEFSSPNYAGGIIWTSTAASKFVINGGTFNAKTNVLASNGPVEINGGTFNGDAELTRNDAGTLTITGGTFNGNIIIKKTTSLTISGEAVVKGNITVSAGAATITVDGGEINGAITASTAGTTIALNGGTIKVTGSALTLSNGAAATFDGTVVEATAQNVVDEASSITFTGDAAAAAAGMGARIGEESEKNYFATLADAVAAAEAGDTITVLKAHSLTAALTISKDLFIEGNGHQITAAGVTTINSEAVVTLNNLNLSNTAAGIGINVTGGAKVTIDGALTSVTATKDIALQISGGSLTVKDGYFTTEKSGKNVLWSNDAASVVVIDGGKFETTGGSGRLLGMSNAAEFTINNGTFVHGGSNNLFQVAGGALITINNGDFSYSNTSNNGGIIWTQYATSKFVINGGTFTANENVLASNGPVEIHGGTFYGVAQLTRNDGGTLTITGGTFNGNITISKKTSLTISGDAVVNGSIIISAAATITVDGGSIISTGDAITTTAAAIINLTGGSITADGSALNLAGGAVATVDGTEISAGSDNVVDENSTIILPYENPYANDAAAIADGMTVRIGVEGGLTTLYFATLDAAVEAAVDGDTITVIKEHELTAALTINKSLNIEGNGLQITAAGVTTIGSNAVVTLNNFKLSNTTSGIGINVTGGAKVTIDGALSSVTATKEIALQISGGSLNVKAGYFTTENSGKNVLWSNHVDSVVVIDGGTFETTGGSGRLLGMSNATEFTINNGTFIHGGTGNNLFQVNGGALLTIHNGEFSSPNYAGGIIWTNNATSKFVINGGTFNAKTNVLASNGPVEINGGTFYGDAELTRNDAGTLAITGGTFNGNIIIKKTTSLTISGEAVVTGNITVSADAATVTVDGGKINGFISTIAAATITVDGGEINGFISASAAATIALNGGTIKTTGNALILNLGASATFNGTVVEADAPGYADEASSITYTGDAAAIAAGMTVYIGDENGKSYFATLADAVAAAEAGDTITVLKAHSLTAALTISKDLFIEGNGLQITAAGVTTINSEAVVTLNNLNLSNTTAGIGINVTGGAMVIIDGANTHVTATKDIALQVSGGSLTVKDGYFTTENSGKNVLWSNDAASVVVIDGGKFETTGGSGRLLGMSNAAEFTINNGTFVHGGTGNNLFQVTGGALITINDGEFSSPNYNGGIIWTSTANSKFVINGGTFNAKTNVLSSNGPVIINGGTFYGVAQLTRNDGGTLTMTGGTFNGDITISKKTSLTISGDAVVKGNISVSSAAATITIDGGELNGSIALGYANANLTVNGGKIISTGDAITTTAAAIINLTGGTITADGRALNLAGGAVATIDGAVINAGSDNAVDETSTIIIAYRNPYADDAAAIANGMTVRIGEEGGLRTKYYATLNAAVEAAEAGDTLTVIKEHELTAALTIGKSLNIEGNGHLITAVGTTTVGDANATGAVVVLNNIKLTNTTTGYGINVTGSANVTIDGSLTSITATKQVAVQCGAGTLTIKNGVFSTETSGYLVLWANSATSVLTVDGGTFKTTGGSKQLLGMSYAKTFTINGGTFIHGGSNNLFQVTGGTKLTINGGHFSYSTTSNNNGIIYTNTPNVTFVINGGTFVGNTNVLASNGPVEINGGTFYGVAQLTRNDGGTLTITGGTFNGNIDVTKNTSLTISGNAKINGNIEVKNTTTSATLTISGNVKFNGKISLGSASTLVIKADENDKAPHFTYDVVGDRMFNFSGSGKLTVTIEAGVFESVCDVFRYYNTNAETVVNINGGEFTGDQGVYFYGAGSAAEKGTFNLNGGTLRADTYAVYANRATGGIVFNIDGAYITHTGGSDKGLMALNYVGLTTNIKSGKLVSLTTNTAAASLLRHGGTVNIYGGELLALNCTDMAIFPTCSYASEAELNIYGGYIESAAKYVIRPAGNGDSNAIVNIYGGYIVQKNISGQQGSVIRVGQDTLRAEVNVFGGTFKTSGHYNAIFWTATDDLTFTALNLHSYNCSGGGWIVRLNAADHADNTYYSNSNKVELVNTITIVTGASLRLVEGSTGIRFTSTISKGFIDKLDSLGATNVSYGTIIVPTDYLTGVSIFTPEAITAAGKTVLDIPAVDGVKENADGSITLRAVMTNVKPGNYNRQFSAIVYAKYTIDGEERVYYSSFDKHDHARSVIYVANEARKDVSEVKFGKYLFEVVIDGVTMYSPYTSAQIKLIDKYLEVGMVNKEVDIYVIAGQSNAAGYSKYTEAFAKQFADGYSNILYAGAGAAGNDFELVDLENVTVGMGATYYQIGAELGMADIFSQYYNPESGRTAVIIKWATGGTNLFDVVTGSNQYTGNWYPPSYIDEYGCLDDNLSGGQYRRLVEVFENTIKDLKIDGYTQFNLNGLFWMQGESERVINTIYFNGQTITIDDSNRGSIYGLTQDLAPYSYPDVFKALVTDLRTDFGTIIGNAAEGASMPVIVGEISSSFGRVHAEHNANFIAMQNIVLPAYVDNCYSLPSGFFATGSDDAHYTAEDMLALGQMVATKMFEVNYPDFEVTAPKAVAAVYADNGTLLGSYSNLGYAINSAPAGATIKLLDNLAYYSGALNINNNKGVTIDGQDFYLFFMGSDRAFNFVGCDVVIENLNVVQMNDDYLAFFYEGAKVTIESGEYDSDIYGFMLESGAGEAALTINGGSFTVNRADHTADARTGYCIYANSATAKVTLNGGTFSAKTDVTFRNGQTNKAHVFVIDTDAITTNCTTYVCNAYATPKNEEIYNEVNDAKANGMTNAEIEAGIFSDYLLYTMESSSQTVLPGFTINGTVVIPNSYYPVVDSEGNKSYVTGDVTLTNPTFTVGQGGTKVGSYYYKAMLSNGGKASMEPDYYAMAIAKYTLDGQLISYSTPMDLDHANDLVYVAATDTLYVVHNNPRPHMISVFKANADSADAPKYIGTFKLGQDIYSMEYNAERDMFVVGCALGESIAFYAGSSFPTAENTADEITAVTSVPQLFKVGTINGFTTQGITCDANYIYMAQHAQACLQVYDWDGNYVGYIQGVNDIMNSTVTVSEKTSSFIYTTWTETSIGGEIESVSYDAVEGKFYFTVLIGVKTITYKQYMWNSEPSESVDSERYAYLVVVDAKDFASNIAQ